MGTLYRDVKSSEGEFDISSCVEQSGFGESAPVKTVQLFRHNDLIEFSKRAHLSKDSADIESARQVTKTLIQRGPTRVLFSMKESYGAELEVISNNFPNFIEVIEYFRCCAELAWRTDKILKFTPVLLNGPAGVGKTKFSEAVAKWIGLDFHRICISSSQDGSEISGSSSFFSNSKPGVPFMKLIHSEYANHLFFLDEIDKNSTKSYDALGGLYTLLEPTSAINFKDLAYPIEIDASQLLWLAASNDIENIPAALASRFTIFEIGVTPEQSRKIVVSIVRECMEKFYPATIGISFSEEALNTLSQASPRKVAQAVTESIGKALLDGVTTINSVRLPAKTNGRIGFLK